jgi:hypothetical protein
MTQRRRVGWETSPPNPGVETGSVRRLVRDAQRQARILRRFDDYEPKSNPREPECPRPLDRPEGGSLPNGHAPM